MSYIYLRRANMKLQYTVDVGYWSIISRTGSTGKMSSGRSAAPVDGTHLYKQRMWDEEVSSGATGKT